MNIAVRYKGITYPSIRKACLMLGLHYPTIISRLRAKPGDYDYAFCNIKYSERAWKDHLGQTFSTLTDMAVHWGQRPVTIQRRLDKGMTIEQALTKKRLSKNIGNSIQTMYKGKLYENIKVLAKKLNIRYETLSRRIKAGIPEDLYGYHSTIRLVQKINGKYYGNMSEISRKFGVEMDVLRDRFVIGLRGDDLIKPPPKRGRVVFINGKRYDSISEAYDTLKPNMTYRKFYTSILSDNKVKSKGYGNKDK